MRFSFEVKIGCVCVAERVVARDQPGSKGNRRKGRKKKTRVELKSYLKRSEVAKQKTADEGNRGRINL